MLAGLSKSSGNQSNVHIALICTALAVVLLGIIALSLIKRLVLPWLLDLI
ncbi:MAG: hypothetical protein KAJ57_10675 [Woeseiaceae bacterium]|nr:hypothetical protein [Woeseiaceae bacterium]